ncbi:MAG TPA: primosomal protein N' [Flavobacterium sp.]|jgi:primosomal protein N' (replication factor Y)
MPFFAEVILPLSLSKTFTYSVSEAEYNFLKPGMRLAVPFGRNKIYTALLYELHQNPPQLYEAREIHQILDEKPIVTKIQLEHWKWMASYYMSPIGDVYRGGMPSALLLESESLISLKEPACDSAILSDDEYLVCQALQQQNPLRVQDVAAILNKKNVLPVLRSLMEKRIVALHEEVAEIYTPKLIRFVRISEEYSGNEALAGLLTMLRNAGKQREAVMHYFQISASEKKPVAVKLLTEKAGVSVAVIKALADKKIFEEYYIQEDRVNFSGDLKEEPKLSPAQQKAHDEISISFHQKDVTLLHGVTSAGKTEVYIRLISQYLKKEKQVLYLLPEIALTAQLVGRLVQYFGNAVSVYHSKYTNNERVEVWNNVLSGSEKAKVVIGARSSLFLPFQDLGLIVIDEEHEQMFKQQDPAPRYHARDAAIVLAKLHHAKVLLGSATPAIESYYNVQTHKYGYVELTERYGNVLLPEIITVDLKDKYFRKKMSGHFSDTLLEAIAEALSLGEQVILFQNRRGYSPVMECLTCGNVPQCAQCDVSLTYHLNRNQLRCHYCGYAMAKPASCHHCGSLDLTTKGFGTEQVQLELAELFPEAKTGRMDQDTTRGKFSLEKMIDSFKNREIDILVGTQMLAKGLDFDNVTLVGIMNADNMLYHPDFRAFERSYQMIAQVSGRAGRAAKQGKVLIQTYNPEHNIIRQVKHHDYIGMYREQLHDRDIYKYPPFYKLVKVTLKHRDFEKLRESSNWLAEVLRLNLAMPVLGPEEPPVGRIRNEYIRTVMIKIPPGTPLEGIKKTIRKILDSFESVSQFRAVKATVNVDVY